MNERLADPERELALVYAEPGARERLRTLWAVDERFGAIVADTGESSIGEMRLLWWREALEGLDDRVPKEPLLERAAEAAAGEGASWGAMAEGWHALLEAPIEAAELERFASERGERLFRLSAELLGGSEGPAERAGRSWALVDLAHRLSDARLAAEALRMARTAEGEWTGYRWPARLRPLGALAVLARRDAANGVPGRRQGSPARVARMAWHRLTGR